MTIIKRRSLSAMFCINCGYEYQGNPNFCVKCGSPIPSQEKSIKPSALPKKQYISDKAQSDADSTYDSGLARNRKTTKGFELNPILTTLMVVVSAPIASQICLYLGIPYFLGVPIITAIIMMVLAFSIFLLCEAFNKVR